MTPSTLISTIRRLAASDSSASGPSGMMPALLTSDVDRAENVLDVVEEALEGLGVGDVELGVGGDAELADRLLEALGVDVADGDLRAVGDQALCGAVADAARTAGDRDDLAVDGSCLSHVDLRARGVAVAVILA